MRVYVAGPIGAPHLKGAEAFIKTLDNIRAGTRACVEILLAGHTPFSPFIDYQFFLQLNPGERISAKRIKSYSMEWLKVCDAIVALPDWENSQGTLDELAEAVSRKIPQYYTIDAFLLANVDKKDF